MKITVLKMITQFSCVGMLVLLSACATPITHSGRMGLLDRLDSGDRVSDSRRGTAVVREQDVIPAQPDPSAVLKLSGEWQWPLENVKVNAPFGERGSKLHKGIDLHATMGTPVFACADGKVIYVGSKIRGYGRMVVVKHADNIFTVYAHHSKNLVKLGRVVKRGDMIARSGRSGHATGPHLHFEIRKGTVSYDPYLAFNAYTQNHSVDRKFASEDGESAPVKKGRRAKRSGKRSRHVAHLESQDANNGNL